MALLALSNHRFVHTHRLQQSLFLAPHPSRFTTSLLMVVSDQVKESVNHEDQHFHVERVVPRPGLLSGHGDADGDIPYRTVRFSRACGCVKERKRKHIRRSIHTAKSTIQGLDAAISAKKNADFSS